MAQPLKPEDDPVTSGGAGEMQCCVVLAAEIDTGITQEFWHTAGDVFHHSFSCTADLLPEQPDVMSLAICTAVLRTPQYTDLSPVRVGGHDLPAAPAGRSRPVLQACLP